LELEDLKKSEIVKKMKAANTVYKNNLGEWCLENTDVKGIEASILKLIKTNESFEMIVLGGGGSAAAVIYCGLVNKNCKKIFCLTRSPEKTLKHYEYFKNENKISVEHLNDEIIEKTISVSNQTSHKKIIINTLPLGLLEKDSNESYREENPYAITLIKRINSKLCCYFDLVYENTQGIKFAQTKGVKCLNGKLMLTTQAKESFFLWTGIKIKN
jgi:shikimate dehydrogenase